jgi:hypothetical protein
MLDMVLVLGRWYTKDGHVISNRYEVHGMLDMVLGAQYLYVHGISNRYEVHGMLDMVIGAQYLYAGHGISNRYVVSGTWCIVSGTWYMLDMVLVLGAWHMVSGKDTGWYMVIIHVHGI